MYWIKKNTSDIVKPLKVIELRQETKVICNQMGYVFENEHIINGFDPGKFLTIENE